MDTNQQWCTIIFILLYLLNLAVVGLAWWFHKKHYQKYPTQVREVELPKTAAQDEPSHPWHGIPRPTRRMIYGL